MKQYNPNQTVRTWSLMPVYSLGVFILGDFLTRTLSWGPIFGYNTWVLYLLFTAGAVFWILTWRSFPVYYVNEKSRVLYRRYIALKTIPPGNVVSIEPITGRVNLFLRPNGFVISIAFDSDREMRLYVLAGNKEFDNILGTAFPGRLRPPYPGG